MLESMLTTIDNPFSPFDDYDAWFAYDLRSGYNSPSYLARVVVTSEDLSETDQLLAIEQGIDEIVELNPLGIYKKVQRELKEDSDETLFDGFDSNN